MTTIPEHILVDIQQYIDRDIAAGFTPREEIVDSIVMLFEDNVPADTLRPLAEQKVQTAWEAHQLTQKHWPETTDCDRLDNAFAELEARSIISRQNFSCCGSCGSAEIWDVVEEAQQTGQKVRGYTFYHVQDTESAVDGDGLCLNYGAVEEGEAAALAIAYEITEVLQKHLLQTQWNGSWNQRIAVKLDWKRRLQNNV